MHRQILVLTTSASEQMLDVTASVREVAAAHPEYGVCSLYARGATAGVMIQENWDPNIGLDVLSCLDSIAPQGRWLHDSVDNNGAAHVKAGLVGPSEVIPMEDGELLLSTWQNIFFCEFDGPRQRRELVVTLL